MNKFPGEPSCSHLFISHEPEWILPLVAKKFPFEHSAQYYIGRLIVTAKWMCYNNSKCKCEDVKERVKLCPVDAASAWYDYYNTGGFNYVEVMVDEDLCDLGLKGHGWCKYRYLGNNISENKDE